MIFYLYLTDGQLIEDLIDMENRICNIEEYIELYKYNIAMELLERLTHLNEIKTQVEITMKMLFGRTVSHVHQL
jgi:DNA-binding HxlR family transcriptional regulator